MRRELAGTGIAVKLIEPGYIATPLTAQRTGRMPGPELTPTRSPMRWSSRGAG